MSFGFRLCRFLPACFVVFVVVIFAGCASSRPATPGQSLPQVNADVTGEDVMMYTGQAQSPRTVSNVTLSADSIYYVHGKTVDRRLGPASERPLQQQPLSVVDSLQIERGGLRGGAIGFAIGAAPGAVMIAEAQAQDRSCESIGCGIGAGLSQAGGAVLMLLGGVAGTLLGRRAVKRTETVYRAPEFSSCTPTVNESRETPN